MNNTRWVRTRLKDGKQMWRGATSKECEASKTMGKPCHHLFGEGAIPPLSSLPTLAFKR